MRRCAGLFGCLLFACLSSAAPAQSHGTPIDRPADALAENVKILAGKPRDFGALIGAGKAALALGDAQAAAGFFGRAEEVRPESPQPQIGKGAALVQEGNPAAALQFLAKAVQLGATQAMVGCERGLAFDLLGQHAQAQADYRAALSTADGDEARRRLALSLAITGNKAEALSLLGPLMARGDAAAARTRALVLALSGDRDGARASIEAAMPGSSQHMEYFFYKLPTLPSPQKASAVHLGIFPDAEQLAALPQVAPPATPPAASGTRLGSVDQLLAQGAAGRAAATPPRQQAQRPSTTARSSPPPAVRADGLVYPKRRVWLEIASNGNAADLADQFRRLKIRHDRLFDGISGYLADDRGRTRLLIGPFRGSQDAEIFARDLDTVRIQSSSWTNAPGQIIRKLPTG